MKPAGLLLLGAGGAVLLALPWLPWPRAAGVPARFDARSETYQRLAKVVRVLDQSCREGDLEAVEARITPAFKAELQQRLRNAGKRLGPAALQGQLLVGEIAAEDLILGASRGHSVVLVFRQGYRTTDVTLVAVVFEWNGYDFLVAKSYSKAAAAEKPGGDSIQRQGEILAGELLADPR